MLSFIVHLATLLAIFPFVFAAPIPIPLFGINFGSGTESKQATTAVSQTTIDSQFLRPAQFARLAYCSSATVTNLTCGGPCDAVQGVTILQTGGDGTDVPLFFVASDPTSQAIVVGHQGTDPNSILSIGNDVEIAQVAPNSQIFPNIPSGVLIHDGFQNTQAQTAATILATVQSALASTGFKTVLVTGHSLGAALAILDGVMFKMTLSSDIQVLSVVFGLPRVGNQAFANMFDSLFPTFSHVTNQNDPVPTIPPQFLSYQHPSGEVHITSVDSNGAASLIACPGQENQECSDADSIFDVSIQDHLGPYFDNVSFGQEQCP